MTHDNDQPAVESLAQERAPLVCSIFTDFDEPSVTPDEWDALVLRAGGDIYSTFDWCRTWWEFYGAGRDLEVYVVRRGGRLVAVFPFFRETLRLGIIPVRAIRLVGCDHTVSTCNVIVEPGVEDEAVAALAGSLGDRKVPWDVISLGALPGYAGNLGALSKAFERHFPAASVETNEDVGVQTLYDLPDTFEGYLAGLSKHRRKKTLEYDRRFSRNFDVAVNHPETPSEAMEAFGRFVELHQALWRARGKLGHFKDWPEAVGFHRRLIERLAPRGRIFLLEIAADGDVVAMAYGFRFGRVADAFLSGRDDRPQWRKWKLGRVAFLKVVQSAVNGGATTLERGRGFYEYKLEEGGRLARLKAITITRPSLRARAGLRLLRFAARVLHIAYYRLWFARIAPRMGVLRGPLWESWIRSKL